MGEKNDDVHYFYLQRGLIGSAYGRNHKYIFQIMIAFLYSRFRFRCNPVSERRRKSIMLKNLIAHFRKSTVFEKYTAVNKANENKVYKSRGCWGGGI